MLTNAHVVGVDPNIVSVHLENVAYSAEVLRISDERDLAMVRICCGNFVVLKRTNRSVRFGERVGALGFPGGEFDYSEGVARTAFERSLNTYLEHTADVQPGGSGGPLLAFPLKAVLRAEEGKGLVLDEGEILAVIGVTSARSLEHELTTYTIFQKDVRAFVDSVWGALGFELTRSSTPKYTIDW